MVKNKVGRLTCTECGRGPFASAQGLGGHYRLKHSIQVKEVKPGEILRRLDEIKTLVQELVGKLPNKGELLMK